MQAKVEFQELLNRTKQTWLQSRELWLDAAAQEFERDLWEPLERETEQLLKSVEEVESVLRTRV